MIIMIDIIVIEFFTRPITIAFSGIGSIKKPLPSFVRSKILALEMNKIPNIP